VGLFSDGKRGVLGSHHAAPHAILITCHPKKLRKKFISVSDKLGFCSDVLELLAATRMAGTTGVAGGGLSALHQLPIPLSSPNSSSDLSEPEKKSHQAPRKRRKTRFPPNPHMLVSFSSKEFKGPLE